MEQMKAQVAALQSAQIQPVATLATPAAQPDLLAQLTQFY